MKLTDALRQEATKAEDLYRRKCQSLDINYTIINGIGKKLCKEHSISPDAVMQLAFQVIEENNIHVLYVDCKILYFRPRSINNTGNLLDRTSPVVPPLLNMVEQKQFVHVQWQRRYINIFLY